MLIWEIKNNSVISGEKLLSHSNFLFSILFKLMRADF